MSTPSFAELEVAAGAVIDILKTMPEFSNSRIAVIGGLGLWNYLRRYRTTEDVDFLITVQGAPKAVKDRLLAMPSSQFQQQAQLFFYKGVGGKSIQIDITPDWQSPYVPSAAVPISAARSNALPYISELDLLVFKINCCGLRPTPAKKLRDATDARTLAEDLCSRGSINLTSAQKIAVLQGLDDVAQLSRRDKSWWVAKLAL
ncbi:hypothetical protein DTO003C3_2557 [Penicillium roqueforti]|uniref:Uncharacterized protein n=2 Tax=Penicillium TaxID=5073 RepID=A0A9W4NLC8_9EURO|nr:hypothetical protein CBS147311_8120 [Penicillium roqueforti]KAI3273071.1 hypothetical protein CBS147308_3131 [Penicillium roqueforti]KAI3294524.1 hypothetical protein DTO003C3_2557 [Penicillium roqueforti]CAG8380360.1 unnamed protein product [Penicillium salamii]CRL29621.1 unnamed protein product [Penicillium camemberti]